MGAQGHIVVGVGADDMKVDEPGSNPLDHGAGHEWTVVVAAGRGGNRAVEQETGNSAECDLVEIGRLQSPLSPLPFQRQGC